MLYVEPLSPIIVIASHVRKLENMVLSRSDNAYHPERRP